VNFFSILIIQIEDTQSQIILLSLPIR